MASRVGSLMVIAAYGQFTQTFGCDAPIPNAYLPVISVLPLSPTFTTPGPVTQNEDIETMNYPSTGALSMSNLWWYLTPDETQVIFSAEVFNFGPDPVLFTFVYSEL